MENFGQTLTGAILTNPAVGIGLLLLVVGLILIKTKYALFGFVALFLGAGALGINVTFGWLLTIGVAGIAIVAFFGGRSLLSIPVFIYLLGLSIGFGPPFLARMMMQGVQGADAAFGGKMASTATWTQLTGIQAYQQAWQGVTGFLGGESKQTQTQEPTVPQTQSSTVCVPTETAMEEWFGNRMKPGAWVEGDTSVIPLGVFCSIGPCAKCGFTSDPAEIWPWSCTHEDSGLVWTGTSNGVLARGLGAKPNTTITVGGTNAAWFSYERYWSCTTTTTEPVTVLPPATIAPAGSTATGQTCTTIEIATARGGPGSSYSKLEDVPANTEVVVIEWQQDVAGYVYKGVTRRGKLQDGRWVHEGTLRCTTP